MIASAEINKNGLVAEWLGRALQKLVQRFESARDLWKPQIRFVFEVFYFAVEQSVEQNYFF